jgi:hypothetical protein
MKRRLLIPLITAGAALTSGVASANTSQHTLQYFRDYGLLLEVSADPRDGSDFVQTNPTHADSLDLVALNDAVRLRGMTVRFSDGRSFSQPMRTIMPGEHVTVQLPANCGVIQNVELDYGRQIVDRTPARLQIFPRVNAPTYAQPAPVYQRDHRRWDNDNVGYYQPQPQPRYVVRPAQTNTGWSGYIQGSFRF